MNASKHGVVGPVWNRLGAGINQVTDLIPVFGMTGYEYEFDN